MPFRFQAKYGLLTYAQCGDLDPFAVVTRLSELGAECIVGREIHEDGGIHLHAFFSFEKKRNLKNERIFDVEGVHPNIQASYGTPEKGYDYAIKDGDVVGGGLERPSGDDTTDKPNKWAEIILAETRDEFFTRVAELDPRALACNFGNLEKYANWRYRVDPEPYSHPRGISFESEGTEDLREWARENIGGTIDGECPKARVGWGETPHLRKGREPAPNAWPGIQLINNQEIDDNHWSYGDLPEWAKHFGQGALENMHISEGCFPWMSQQRRSTTPYSTTYKED